MGHTLVPIWRRQLLLLLSVPMLNFSIQVNIYHNLFIYLNPTGISIAPYVSGLDM